MQEASELKDQIGTTTWHLVLMTLATAGIYPILWMWRHSSLIERTTGRSLGGDLMLIWIAVCIGWSSALVGTGEVALDIISSLFSLALAVLYIVWAFQARSALQQYALTTHGVDLRMNVFYTLLFTLYYVNYCINDLPEVKRKQAIIAGHSEPVA